MPEQRASYSPEFRRDAVNLVETSGQPIAEPNNKESAIWVIGAESALVTTEAIGNFACCRPEVGAEAETAWAT